MRSVFLAIIATVQLVVIAVLIWFFVHRGSPPAPAPPSNPEPVKIPQETVFHSQPSAVDPQTPVTTNDAQRQQAPAESHGPSDGLSGGPQAGSDHAAPQTPGKPSLGVLPFSIDPGIEQVNGESLADMFQAEIDRDKYDLYDRTALTRLMENERLQQTDRFDHSDQSAKFAKLAKVQYVLIGSVSRPARGNFQITAKIVESTGRVGPTDWVTTNQLQRPQTALRELAMKMRVARNQEIGQLPTPPPLFDDLKDAVNPNAAFDVDLWTQKKPADFEEGEDLQVSIRVGRSCYIKLITWDSQDNATLLFPNHWDPQGRLEAGRVLTIPMAGAEYHLPIQPPHGRTLLKVIATTDPLILGGVSEKDIRQGPATVLSKGTKAIGLEGRQPVQPVKIGPNSDDVSVLLALDPSAWATADMTITTRAKEAAAVPAAPAPLPGDPVLANPPATADANQSLLEEWQRLSAGPVQGRGIGAGLIEALGNLNTDEVLVFHPAQAVASKGIGGGKSLLGDVTIEKVSPNGTKGAGLPDMNGRIAELQKQRDTIVVPNIRVRGYELPATRLMPVQWALHNKFNPGNDIGWDQAAPQIQSIHTGLIGVVDSGINLADPRLAPLAWTNPQPGQFEGCVNDVHGWNFVGNNDILFDPAAPYMHGSMCASIIAGRADSSNPGAVVGIVPDGKLITAVGLAQGAAGQAPTGSLVSVLKSIAYCAQEGAQVINLSLGGPMSSEDLAELQKLPLWDELERRNVILVAAAGNDHANNDTNPCFPACLKRGNIVCVMAVDPSGHLATVANATGKWMPFSNYGKQSVHLAAPGTLILGIPGKDHVCLDSGTSFAAPIVTGTIALIQGAHPDWNYRQVINALMRGTRPVPELSELCVTGGVVNVYKSLQIGR